jgi:hypothetical protein
MGVIIMKEINVNESFLKNVEIQSGLESKIHISSDRIIDSVSRAESVEEEENGEFKITTTILLGVNHDIKIPAICRAKRVGKAIKIFDVVGTK